MSNFVSIDLSKDDVKYVSRYIGNNWQKALPPTWIERLNSVFGHLSSTIYVRRKTIDELTNHCLKHLEKKGLLEGVCKSSLRSLIRDQIGRGTTGVIKVNENLTLELVLKW